MTRMSTNFFKGLLATVAGGLMALSVGGTASAAGLGGNFSIDPTCGGNASCAASGSIVNNIDSINFRYSALVNQQNSGGILTNQPFQEDGYMFWTGYLNDAGNTAGSIGPGVGYNVYALFSATGTASFNAGSGGIDAAFNSFTISFYMDGGANTQIALPGTFGPPVVTDPGSPSDALLATATLLGQNQARLFSGFANGDFKIVLTDLGLSTLGSSFFTDPSPFYHILEFTGVTTQISNASITAPFVASLTGSGDLYFPVPEPASLGLIGIGLLSMGGLLYRRRRAVTV